MTQVLLKTGKLIEISDEEMLTFLEDNKNLIQDRKSTRKRKILK